MRSIAIWLLPLVTCAALTVGANDPAGETWREDRFFAEVGVYRPNVSTKMQVTNPLTGEDGTLLDLEGDLDLEDRKSLLTIDLHWRFAPRHAIEFEFVSLERRAEHPIEFRIEFEDKVFEVDEVLESVFDTTIARLGYRFSFINNERMEVSGSAGLHITDLKVGLNRVEEPDKTFNTLTAPLPAFGLAFKYRFTDTVHLRVRGEWLDVKIDDIDGALTSAVLDVSWYPWQNVGFSFGYNLWEVEIKTDDPDLVGRISYDFGGPELGLRFRF